MATGVNESGAEVTYVKCPADATHGGGEVITGEFAKGESVCGCGEKLVETTKDEAFASTRAAQGN